MQIEIKDPGVAAYIAALIVNGPDEIDWRIRRKISEHFPGGTDAAEKFVDHEERSEIYRQIWDKLQEEGLIPGGGIKQWVKAPKDIVGYSVVYSSKGATIGCKLFSKETLKLMLEACHD